MATRRDVIAAFVVDEAGVIVAASRYPTIGFNASAMLPAIPEDLRSDYAARLAAAETGAPGSLVVARDKNTLVAYYPLLVTADRHALRSARCGALVLVSGWQLAKGRALEAAGVLFVDSDRGRGVMLLNEAPPQPARRRSRIPA